jgi:hypothetical protein
VVAVALSDVYRVGVGVEPAVRRDADPIVWSELSASERARLATAPEPERAWWFLRMWTLDQEPYWLAVAARPGHATRPLLADDLRQHGTPVG